MEENNKEIEKIIAENVKKINRKIDNNYKKLEKKMSEIEVNNYKNSLEIIEIFSNKLNYISHILEINFDNKLSKKIKNLLEKNYKKISIFLSKKCKKSYLFPSKKTN